MADPVLLEVPASHLTGFSIKIRCGPRGTRIPIISRPAPDSEDASSSTSLLPSKSSSEDLQLGDSSLERALHLSFDDDGEGAFLNLSFSPNSESGGRQENFLNHSTTSLQSWQTPSFPSPVVDPVLWNTAGHIPIDDLGQDKRLPLSKHTAEPTLNQTPGFDLYLHDMHGINPISPFPNNAEDLDSLMLILTRNAYSSASIHSTIPGPGSGSSTISGNSAEVMMKDLPPSGTSRRDSISSSPNTSAPSPDANSDFKENPLSHPYPCPQPGCNRKFKREYNLSLHIRTHEPRPKKRFACTFPACNGLRFSRKHDLFRHICNIHSDTAPWTCDWCSSEFPNSEALVAHIRLHCKSEAGTYAIVS